MRKAFCSAVLLIVFGTIGCPPPPAKAQEATPTPATVPPTPASPSPAPKTQGKTPNTAMATVVLTDGSRSVVRTAKELGLYPQVDMATVTAALKRLAPQFHQDAVDASLIAEKGQVRIDPGTYARSMNIAATVEKLTHDVKPDGGKQIVAIVLDKKPPAFTADRLKGISSVLSRVQTKAWEHSGRNHNIELAASLIDGTLLASSEQFSLNKIVGERSKARGFREAVIFVNSQEVKGVGGGVSQITGTTFNAAAEAGLKIDEAHLHSRPVAYLPLGHDVTVVYGQEDMRFTNDTKGPIYISMKFDFPYLTVTMFGTKVPGRTVKLTSRVQRLGPGRINAQLYRTIKDNGKLVRKEKLVSHAYRWDPKDNKVHDL